MKERNNKEKKNEKNRHTLFLIYSACTFMCTLLC